MTFPIPPKAAAKLADRAEPPPTAEQVERRELTARFHCAVCGDPIERPHDAYNRVEGWERPRAQGGTNAIRLRKALPVYACVLCIDVRKGVLYEQGQLA